MTGSPGLRFFTIVSRSCATDIFLPFAATGQVTGTRDVANLYAFPHTPHSQLSVGLSYTAPPTTAGAPANPRR